MPIPNYVTIHVYYSDTPPTTAALDNLGSDRSTNEHVFFFSSETVWDGGSSRRHLSPTSISQVINPCRLCLHRWESLQHNSLVKGNYKRQRWKVSKVDLTPPQPSMNWRLWLWLKWQVFAKQKTDIICNGYILIRSWIRRWCRSNSQF